MHRLLLLPLALLLCGCSHPDVPAVTVPPVVAAPLSRPDPGSQHLYDRAKQTGLLQRDTNANSIGSEMRQRGMVQDTTPPASLLTGATGVCRDDTYTFAIHHQGACSHHGGVKSWLP